MSIVNSLAKQLTHCLIRDNTRIGMAEDEIRNYYSDPGYWVAYTNNFANTSTDSQCWQWLKDSSFNIEYTIEILNKRKSFSIEMQEYICINRPDLIRKISNLNPKLKEKYKHELSMSGIEV